MNRREFLEATSGCLFALSPAGGAQTWDAGPHLFLDDYLIARQENLQRVVSAPVRAAAPAIDLIARAAGACSGNPSLTSSQAR